MGELLLRNAVSLNGFASLYYTTTTTTCINLSKKQLKVSIFMLFNASTCLTSIKPMNMLLDSRSRVASVDYETLSVNEEEQMYDFIKIRNPCGGSNISASDVEPERDCEPKTISSVSENEINVHYLEETDEDVLSRRILGLSRSNKVTSSLGLFHSMELAGLRPSVHCCNSLLSCLLRNQRFGHMFRVFESMKKNEIGSTGHTYSLMLKATMHTQGFDAALKLFEGLENKILDVMLYNMMISICAKVDNWVEARGVWTRMKENGEIGTQVTYNLLICTFVRSGQNELAIDAYHEMLQNGFEPGDDIMQATISACTKEGKWDSALNMFQNMLSKELKPNQVTCNALINSLGKAGKVKLAFKVYGVMSNIGYKPDKYTWNALLGALYRANRHADALELFERIEEEHLNVHLYNTALMACQKLGLWDKALQLLWKMEAEGLSVPTTSYNVVIGACEVARKPKVSLEVYEHMVHQKCPPDTFTHLSLIRSCIWGSLWTEVEQILNEYLNYRKTEIWTSEVGSSEKVENRSSPEVEPNASLYNTAIQGMCLRGEVESAKELYTRMQTFGLKPDGKTGVMMLQNLHRYSNKTKGRKR
ncbi:hypothetical protein ACFE04_004467 [Oxalis oulophora]